MENNNNNNGAVVPKQVTMEDLMQLLSQLNTTKSTTENLNQNTQPIQIPEKLNTKNFVKWAKLMQLELGGRGRLNHITAPPPSQEDPEYTKWSQWDSLVIAWIIGNIDPELQNQFLDYPNARELWKGIETLYGGTKDGLQIYDLTVKSNRMTQGSDEIEVYYGKLTAIWKEIDRRSRNPMIHSEEKTIYNRLVQQNRLYQFIAGLDNSLDKDRRDILNTDPLPTVEEAFARIRRKVSRRQILKIEDKLATGESGIGSGFAAKGKAEKPSFWRDDEKAKLRCSHCGGSRHTKDGCFKLIGYPEWWTERKKKGEKITGKAAYTAGEETTEGDGTATIAAAIEESSSGLCENKERGFLNRGNHWAWY